ncbi:MAG: hypothetical protein Q9174_006184 [Haloplaca sp. 1 TL-2023]
MRLLHVSTFELESFIDEECPPYILLSHTWGKEEITFQEILREETVRQLKSAKAYLSNKNIANDEQYKQGCLKIAGCALRAHEKGFDYIWCDTCCIDKTNSTELSEAINSMYIWYKDQLCYVYLADVPSGDLSTPEQREHAFYSSRWFTRGWTLQELIAPANIIFFDAAWLQMGEKAQFRTLIAQRTGIDEGVLAGDDPLRYSIATRMSWASQRQTTRVEDQAYCLMGLFDVNMPLIYGEKHKAFLRLQTEIMRLTEDHSLFAWRIPEGAQDNNYECGLLANSPADFVDSGNVVPMTTRRSHIIDSSPPVSMTSRGVSISLPLLEVHARKPIARNGATLYFATLQCRKDARGPLGIFLSRGEDGLFRRRLLHRLNPAIDIIDGVGGRTFSAIHVPQRIDQHQRLEVEWQFSFHIPELPEDLLQCGLVLEVIQNPENPRPRWDPAKRISDLQQGMGAVIYLGDAAGPGKLLIIGIDDELRVRCVLHSTEEKRLNRKDTGIKTPSGKLWPIRSGKALSSSEYIISSLWKTWQDSFRSSPPMRNQQLLHFDIPLRNDSETYANRKGGLYTGKSSVNRRRHKVGVRMGWHQGKKDANEVTEVEFDRVD